MIQPTWHHSLFGAGLCLLVACGGGGEGGAPAGGSGAMDGPDFTIAPAYESRWVAGALDGEDWEVFGSIADLVFNEAGDLFILDEQAGHVVAFDRDGVHLRTISRQGEGPGETDRPRIDIRARRWSSRRVRRRTQRDSALHAGGRVRGIGVVRSDPGRAQGRGRMALRREHHHRPRVRGQRDGGGHVGKQFRRRNGRRTGAPHRPLPAGRDSRAALHGLGAAAAHRRRGGSQRWQLFLQSQPRESVRPGGCISPRYQTGDSPSSTPRDTGSG